MTKPLKVSKSESLGKVSKSESLGKVSKSESLGKVSKLSPKTLVSPTTFVLKNISAIQTVLSTYAHKNSHGKLLNMEEGLQDIPQTLLQEVSDIPVTELLHEKSKAAYYFLDSRKTQGKFWGIMKDITQNGPLPNTTQKTCWWCRHKFTTRPLGCPLRYHKNKTSGIERERVVEKLTAANLPADTTDFFETEGLFCSFPCCKAYILDEGSSVKYKDSLGLLSLLYSILHGIKNSNGNEICNFPSAPSWKLLKEYGGHLKIEEWRASIGKLIYEPTVNTLRPYMFSSSQYISEKKVKMFKDVNE